MVYISLSLFYETILMIFIYIIPITRSILSGHPCFYKVVKTLLSLKPLASSLRALQEYDLTTPSLMDAIKAIQWTLSSTVPFPHLNSSHSSSDSLKDMPKPISSPMHPSQFLPSCFLYIFNFSSILFVLPITILKSFLHLKAKPKTVSSFMYLRISQKKHTVGASLVP